MTSPSAELLGVACESGGFRCAFVHGVLARLERDGVHADMYAAVSASVLPAALAAIGRADEVGVGYWDRAHHARYAPGHGMTEMVLAGIEKYGPLIESNLFTGHAARLLVGVSEVIDPEAAEATQGRLASRLGREQLLAMDRGDASWAQRTLHPVMFDTAGGAAADLLTPERFRSVAYATTRMLHAWRLPAEVDGRPCIDGSYTVGCPVHELLALGCTRVIAIAAGHGPLWRNLYRSSAIDGMDRVTIIRPMVDLKSVGVDFTTATIEGLRTAYQMGTEGT